jgi:hypothetical protein
MTVQGDNVQQSIFEVMEKVPSPVYFWAGMVSILGSLILHQMGRKQDALFVGQWPPTFFILAVLYKQVRPSRES